MNEQKASDLAQEAWRRVLRTRANLRPDGNFFAYLSTTATNIWRDQMRLARRSGPLAESRILSLDASQQTDEGESFSLSEAVADLGGLDKYEQLRLKLDIDQALAQLAPLLRDVLVIRFIEGQSAAVIGRLYGRTEQTVSGWIRQALRLMRSQLEDLPRRCQTVINGR